MTHVNIRFFARPQLYSVLLVLLVVSVYLKQNWSSIASSCGSSGDFALTAFEAQKAESFEVLTGPYSRAQFRHPGPINVYLYALGKAVLPIPETAEGRYRATQALISILVLGLGIFAAATLFSWIEAGPLLLVVLLMTATRVRRDLFFSLWGPSTIVLPAFTFMLASAAVASGRLGWIAVQLFTAVVIVQTHVGGVVLVAPVFFVSLGICAYRFKQQPLIVTRATRNLILTSILVYLLAWFPPLYEAFVTPQGGNVGEILKFLSSDSPPNSLYQSLDYLAGFYKSPLREVAPVHRIAVFIMLLLALALLPLRKESAARILRWLLFVGIAASYVGARGIDDLGKQYLMWWQYSLVSLTYFLILAALFQWLGRLFERLASEIHRFHIGVTLVSAIVALVTVNTAYAVRERPCGTFYDDLVAYVAPVSETLYLVSIEDFDQWQTAAGLVQRLHAKGVSVCTKGWGFMFGEDFVCRKVIEQSASDRKVKLKLFDSKRFGSERSPPEGAFVGKRTVVERQNLTKDSSGQF